MDCVKLKIKGKEETFLLRTNSKDGYEVIIGGICPKGKKDDSIGEFINIKNKKLGQSKDTFLIDYILAKAVTDLSPDWIKVVGASIRIKDVEENTGGIIGSVNKSYESAHGLLEEIEPNLYLIASPGGPGVAFKGSLEDGKLIEKIIQDNDISCEKIMKIVLEEIRKITNLFIIVLDGSGNGNNVGIFVSDYNGENKETFS